MKPILILGAELDRTETWIRYESSMCHSCISSCCTMPVEVRFNDLLRIGLVEEFERSEPRKAIAKRLQKDGIVARRGCARFMTSARTPAAITRKLARGLATARSSPRLETAAAAN